MRTATSKKSILIVDDEDDIRDTLRDVFEDEGYVVEAAANGEEALAVLRARPKPALVILDLLMPIMDGNALYRAMKADPAFADIPVIVSSSDPSRAPSGVLIVKKPVNLEMLIDAVSRHAS